MTPILELTAARRIRIRPDIDKLPIVLELPRQRKAAMALMAVVCILASASFGLYGWLAPGITGGGDVVILVGLLITLAVLLLGWRGMRQYVLRDTQTISREGVTVLFRGLLRDSTLHWPLSACKGLRRRELQLTGRDGAKVRYTLIEITHESGAAAPVIVERGLCALSDELYALSDLLGLAILTDD